MNTKKNENKKARSAAQKAADKRYAEKNKDNHKQFAVNLNNDEYDKIIKVIAGAGLSKADFLRWAANELEKKK